MIEVVKVQKREDRFNDAWEVCVRREGKDNWRLLEVYESEGIAEATAEIIREAVRIAMGELE